MIKNISIAIILALFLFQSTAFAFDTDGEVIFKDTLYGATIGGLLGAMLYVGNQEDFSSKLSGGVIIGTIAGLVFGLHETDSFVELKDNKIKVAIPTPVIVPKEDGIEFAASLFKANF